MEAFFLAVALQRGDNPEKIIQEKKFALPHTVRLLDTAVFMARYPGKPAVLEQIQNSYAKLTRMRQWQDKSTTTSWFYKQLAQAYMDYLVSRGTPGI